MVDVIVFDGKQYDIDDFELGELEWIEDELGGPLTSDSAKSMKAAVRFITVIKRREDPSFTVDDARKLKLSVFTEDDPAEEKPQRPTKGKRAA